MDEDERTTAVAGLLPEESHAVDDADSHVLSPIYTVRRPPSAPHTLLKRY
jgi:hypothetical protein